MTDRLTTAEVAGMLDVNMKTLQGWVRDGKVSAEVKGKGTHRRVLWTEQAVEQARRIRDRVAGDSSLASAMGPDVAAALELARKAQQLQSESDVVVATPQSARVFRNDATLSDVMRRTGGKLMVIIGR